METGCKKLVRIFVSYRVAQQYRRDTFGEEIILKHGKSLEEYYPIEKWKVFVPSEVKREI